MLVDATMSANLKALYALMETAPMSKQDYADWMAQIIDTQTKTGTVTTVVTIPSTSAPGSPSAGSGTGAVT